MNYARSLLAGLALASLAGCAGNLTLPSAETNEVAGLLANYDRVSALPADEQRREFNAAQATYENAPTDTARLNLALMILLPRASWHDDRRVESLLAGIPAAADGRRSSRHDLAQLLLKIVAEREREAQRRDQLAQELRDERRKTEDLRQKIESLRAIDRDMGSRKRVR